MSVWIAVAVLAFVASWATTLVLARKGSAIALDVPNHRSLHDGEIPRTGGMGILAGLGVALMVERLAFGGIATGSREMGAVLLAAAGAALVFLADDLEGLPILFRLVVQFALAGATVWVAELWRLPIPAAPWIATTVAVLAVVWMMNLYNFMDGMDGFAAGMTITGFGVLALLGFRAGESSLGLVALAAAAAGAGFLPLNRPVAKIFMGDGGSVTLGFLAGALALFGVSRGVFSIWVPVLAFSPFILDATFTLLKRALAGKKVWLAHREHLYQRLVLSGWSQGRAVALEYAFMGMGLAAALAFDRLPGWGQASVLTGWALGFTVFALFVSRRESASAAGTLIAPATPSLTPPPSDVVEALAEPASGDRRRAVSA